MSSFLRACRQAVMLRAVILTESTAVQKNGSSMKLSEGFAAFGMSAMDQKIVVDSGGCQ